MYEYSICIQFYATYSMLSRVVMSHQIGPNCYPPSTLKDLSTNRADITK